MTDITHIFETYRECARHLWNQFYLPIHRNRKESDPWLEFDDVENHIFYDLVLRGLGYSWDDYFGSQPDFHQAIPFLPFRIVTDGVHGVPAMISREPRLSGYWDHPVKQVLLQTTDMRFVQLFDWDEQGFRNYQYFMVKVMESAETPAIVGHYALVDTQHVKVMHEDVRPVR